MAVHWQDSELLASRVTSEIDLAVIGGSGFYEMPGLSDVEELVISTPFGEPSDPVRVGTLEGRRVAFLARHGRGHRYLPSEIPVRANFWALKSLGVQRVIGVSAVGSLSMGYRPRDFVAPDQLIDRTSGMRAATFFGEGVIAHIGMAEPFCARLRAELVEAAQASGATAHDGGSLVVIEGPAFGTRAESHLYRSWGAAIVGMTALPEAKLAREAEMCFALLTAVTDYDSWNTEESDVDATTVFEVLSQNVARSREIVRRLAVASSAPGACDCGQALDAALVTPAEAIPASALDRLRPILARRLGLEGA